MRSDERPKAEVRLANGDVLIVPTTARDERVDAAFKDAADRVRKRTRERFLEFRTARRAA